MAILTVPQQPDIPLSGSTITGSSISPYGGGVVSGQTFNGGNFLGTLNGSIALSTYSVDLNGSVSSSLGGTYDATVTTDGTSFGVAVPNAGAIAWLLTNLGPAASSADQQGALQAAIWRTEYGVTLGTTGFQLDGADNNNDPGDNDPTLIAEYKADIAALGAQTASVGSVDWISPTDQFGGTAEQGLVALKAGIVEPLSLPNTSVPDFNYSYFSSYYDQTNYESQPAGNFLGTLNGSTNLTATYCLSISQGISTPGTFDATMTTNAAIFGSIVPNAGEIAWLVTNLGPSAVSGDQQNALQAAIWRVEYGSPGFELAGADYGNSNDNDAALIADYQADLGALGSHTAAVGSVYWISPTETAGGGLDQGLVAVSIPSAPTQTSLSPTANPAAYGQALTFVATVQNVQGGATPTGWVQFQINGGNDGGPVPLSGGVASLGISGLPAGGYSVSAIYLPQGNFAGSTSAAYSQTIIADATVATVAPKTTVIKRKKVLTLAATVANANHQGSGTPTGTVSFLIDGHNVGSATLINGKASFQLAAKFAKGKHKVSVVYTPGTGNFARVSALLQGGRKVVL